jgi:hypothetical protein
MLTYPHDEVGEDENDTITLKRHMAIVTNGMQICHLPSNHL